MKALAYRTAHPLDAFAIELIDTAEPRPRDTDLLVSVRAVGINPGEAAIRRTRGAAPGGRIILGFEFAGVVESVGARATGFAVGDRVLGTGDMSRDGAWAERLAVDHRVVARIPDGLSFTDAASLPIGGLTAWEALFRDRDGLAPGIDRVLIVGGAGGVGTMAAQLLKSRTTALVVSTASRPASREWCTATGADLVVDHTGDVPAQLRDAGIDRIDLVLSTSGTAGNVGWIAEVLRPFGHLAAVDLHGSVDLGPLIGRSVSVHTETVFSRITAGVDVAVQGGILAGLAADAVAGRLRPITTTVLDGLRVDTMRTAHELVESGRTVGKTVIRC
ncbi:MULTISPECIES: alcohol dehydrogenase catalytic domain-containing protein [Catenuloplanes]|uniref:Zinc-binding alcohol dehydrogenase family protein n=1 Tax=Catenuloplanes niger TaxID=587534 RepID=A0AAE4CS66_9ACTN|nr:zinc-binding dehydrogenase [Catenuloplanes niger]MDR7320908.1 zinc-binding alcohol dehydrogenase family protein [Catenuloplanes niger]